MHVLDTDVCIDLLRGRGKVLEAVEPLEAAGRLGVTAVTLHELVEGAHRARDPGKALGHVNRFLTAFDVLPYDAEAARIGGRVAGELAKAGTPIGDLDTMIAATAVRHGGSLVTRNVRHFSRVPGLQVQPLRS